MKLKHLVQALIGLVGIAVPVILWRKLEELVPPHSGQLLVLVLWTVCVCLAVSLIARPLEIHNLRKKVAGIEGTVNQAVSRNVTLMRRLVYVYGILHRPNANPCQFTDWHDALNALNGGPTAVLSKAEAGIPLVYPQFAGLPLPADDATEWESARCILAGIRNRQFDRR